MQDRSTYTLPLAVAATVTVAALYWTSRQQKKSHTSLDECIVELLPIEQTLARGGGGDNAMSTLTWFQGDATQAAKLLRERVAAVLHANPWLAGCIRSHQGSPTLVYHKTVSSEVVEAYFRVIPNQISRDVPLTELGSKVAHFLLKTGPNEPLWKVALYPCSQNPTSGFAVVASMSHVIGDGATYYKILNMILNHNVAVESLLVTRITSSPDQQIQVLGGKAEYGVLSSAGFIGSCVAGVLKALWNKKKYTAHSLIYLVDPEGMATTKKAVVSQAAGEDADPPSFVSSNDVLTSWFFQNCNCQHGFMAMNFRGRLEGHTDAHAGNYESVLFYRLRDSASPALIRKSISTKPFKRQVTADQPIPGFWPMLSSSNGICTNWASFAQSCQLEGCQEEIHIPLYNVATLIPSNMAVCFVFRAGPQGLAVYVTGSPDKLEWLEKAVPFLKQHVVVA